MPVFGEKSAKVEKKNRVGTKIVGRVGLPEPQHIFFWPNQRTLKVSRQPMVPLVPMLPLMETLVPMVPLVIPTVSTVIYKMINTFYLYLYSYFLCVYFCFSNIC